MSECPWKATIMLCLSANGATRLAELTVAEAVITGTPKALAITKPRSISSSVKLSLKLRLNAYRLMPASSNFLRTALISSSGTVKRHLRRSSRETPLGSMCGENSSHSPNPISTIACSTSSSGFSRKL